MLPPVFVALIVPLFTVSVPPLGHTSTAGLLLSCSIVPVPSLLLSSMVRLPPCTQNMECHEFLFWPSYSHSPSALVTVKPFRSSVTAQVTSMPFPFRFSSVRSVGIVTSCSTVTVPPGSFSAAANAAASVAYSTPLYSASLALAAITAMPSSPLCTAVSSPTA